MSLSKNVGKLKVNVQRMGRFSTLRYGNARKKIKPVADGYKEEF